MRVNIFCLVMICMFLGGCAGNDSGGGDSSPAPTERADARRCERAPANRDDDYCHGILDEGRHHDCDRDSREALYSRYCGRRR